MSEVTKLRKLLTTVPSIEQKLEGTGLPFHQKFYVAIEHLSGMLDMKVGDAYECWIEESVYKAVVEENEGYKKMISSMNRHVLPGECDSVDSFKKILEENEKLRNEVKTLRVLRGLPSETST